jgi:ABC-type multidrug transport system ATPase subunit/ABC-type transporter Mla maintaining outer membrane lipid asymmetry permease subunit MlaE
MNTTATSPAQQQVALRFRRFGMAHRTPDGDDPLLEGVDLELPARRFYVLVGTSGGGKSSLLRLLAGLVETREPAPRLDGALEVFGRDVVADDRAAETHDVLAILQDEGLLDELSPRQNVELALRAAGRSRRLAPALLARAGLSEPPERVAQLSGGMRKRVAVARALASEPRLLLCDEPTAGLDARAARQIAEVLRDAHDQGSGEGASGGSGNGRTTIVITHDVGAFAGLADGLLVLDRASKSLTLHPPDHVVEASATAPTPNLGEAAAGDPPGVHGLRRLLLRATALAETIVESVRRLPPVELGQTVRTTVRFVLEPILFVALAGAVIGGLATFFALRNNPIQGGFESALLTGTGKVATAVLVPLLSGFFFTARIAAGAAARLGTMKRTNQVAALAMMGVRPADYLLTPLVWAMVLAMPVVTFAGVVAAAVAGAVAAHGVANMTWTGWATAWFQTVDARDFVILLGKCTLSGYLVALCCYHLGVGPKRSGAEVGEAVNEAIVVGMAMVLAVHAGMTFVAYA